MLPLEVCYTHRFVAFFPGCPYFEWRSQKIPLMKIISASMIMSDCDSCQSVLKLAGGRRLVSNATLSRRYQHVEFEF